MTYANLYELTTRIEKYHDTFAEKPATDPYTFTILEEMADYMDKNPAVVGITFESTMKAKYGGMNTLITINKDDAGWDVIEQVRKEEE